MLNISWALSTVWSTWNALCNLVHDLPLCTKYWLGCEIRPRKAAVGIFLVRMQVPRGKQCTVKAGQQGQPLVWTLLLATEWNTPHSQECSGKDSVFPSSVLRVEDSHYVTIAFSGIQLLTNMASVSLQWRLFQLCDCRKKPWGFGWARSFILFPCQSFCKPK